MSALRNVRLEAVAQELAAGKTAAEASELAGYDMAMSSALANAKKRAHRKDIRARVAEIRAPGVARAEEAVGITAEWMLTKLHKIANHELGKKKTKVADQIAALNLAAKIKGLLAPDKHDHQVEGAVTVSWKTAPAATPAT